MIRLERADKIASNQSSAGEIAIVTIDRPEAKNALDRASMIELDAAIGELERDPLLAAAVITAAGDHFVSGGDLRDLSELTSGAEGRAMSLAMQATLSRLAALPFPTIAAIGGDAYGGGCELAMACDMRVLAGSARMVWKQVGMGLAPGWGGGQRLQRLVGPSRALRWLVTAAAVSPAEALASGLVDRLAGEGETALGVALEIAARIAEQPRAAVRAVKRALSIGASMPLAAALDFEAELFGQLWGQGDHQAAVAAFLARAARTK